MDKESQVNYWLETADRDWKTLEHLFASHDFHWGLFIGHLILEKTFKALYVKQTGEIPPRIHDLTRLAEKCGLKPDPAMLDKLDLITRFNLSIRYPDYRQEIYKICNDPFSREVLDKIKEVRTWLMHQIAQS